MTFLLALALLSGCRGNDDTGGDTAEQWDLYDWQSEPILDAPTSGEFYFLADVAAVPEWARFCTYEAGIVDLDGAPYTCRTGEESDVPRIGFIDPVRYSDQDKYADTALYAVEYISGENDTVYTFVDVAFWAPEGAVTPSPDGVPADW